MSLFATFRTAAAASLFVLLTACSGAKEGDPDFVPPTTPVTPPVTSAPPAAVRLVFSAPALQTTASSADSGVTVTAIVTDASNNALPAQPVAFSADSGVLIVTTPTTDSTGSAAVTLTTGGDTTPRTINIVARVGSTAVTTTSSIPVSDASGSGGNVATLNLVSDRDTLATTDSTADKGINLQAIATDSQGRLVENAPITYSVTTRNGAIAVTNATTNDEGVSLARLTTGGDATPRSITVQVTSGSVSATKNFTVSGSSNPSDTVQSITLTKSKNTLNSTDDDFTKGVQINALLTNAAGQVVAGAPVSFAITSGGGAIQTTKPTTDATGTATSLLSTGGDSATRDIVVTATSGSRTASITVPVVSQSVGVGNLALSTDRAFLGSGDATPSRALTVTALATNSSGQVVSGAQVNFSVISGGGAIQPVNNGVTADDGTAIARLTTGGNSSPRTIRIQAAVGSRTATIDIPVRAEPSVVDQIAGVTLSKSRNSLATTDAQIDQAVLITATVTDSGGRTLPGAPVDWTLASSNGVITVDSTTTDSTGRAQARVTTGGNQTQRTITVRVVSGSQSSTIDVPVIQPGSLNDVVARIATSTTRTALSATDDTLEESLTINAQLLDGAGVAVVGARASFGITSGGGALTVTNGGLTDDNGVATAQITNGGDPTARNINVQILSGNASATVVVPVQAGGTGTAVARIALSATSTTLTEDQSNPDTAPVLTATLLDSNSAAITGANAVFSVTAGDGAIVPVTTTSDDSGRVTARITTGGNPATRSFTVRVSSGSVSASQVFNVVERIASVQLITSQPSLPSAADTDPEAVTITASVLDSSNRRVPGIQVNLSSTSGQIAVPSSFTDSNGTVQARLTTGGDPSPRVIRVTATAGNKTSFIDVPVSGSTLALDAPSSIGSGDVQNIVAQLTDSSGGPIVNRPITLASALGNPIAPATASTDSNGVVVFSYTATRGGNDTLTASGLGLTSTAPVSVSTFRVIIESPTAGTEIPLNTLTTVRVRVTMNGANSGSQTVRLSTTRGTLGSTTLTTNGTGLATTTISSSGAGGAGGALITATGPESVSTSQSVEFVSTVADTLTLQPERSSIPVNASTTIVATARDNNGNLVKNQNVTFNLTDTTGGQLSATQARTDAQGRAFVTYQASSTSSGANGVTIRATLASLSAQTTLTVGGQAARIVIGTGNNAGENPERTLNLVPYTAIVTDAAGNPVNGGTISLTAISTGYQKGRYNRVDTDGDGVLDSNVISYSATPQNSGAFGCLNEDINLDGTLQSGEDFNTNGALDPGNPASVPATVTLDPNGQATFNVTYPKSFANWTEIRLAARITVSGTESSASAQFVLPALSGDLAAETPPGQISPFGQASSCSSPN